MKAAMMHLFITILALFYSCAFAQEGPQPLPPEKAFVFSTQMKTPNQILLKWNLAPGYYLYRERLKISVTPGNQLKEKIVLPEGVMKENNIRGKFWVYLNSLNVPLVLSNPHKGKITILIQYQGCSIQGYCYAPVRLTMNIDLANPQFISNDTTFKIDDSPMHYEKIFNQQNIFWTLLIFFGLGLLLSLTPCVLPMIPILSSIVIGQQKSSGTLRAFLLSLTYVLGLAITYAIAGVIVALVGHNIQAALQKPWIVISFSILFALLALSLFGFYDFALPPPWQEKIMRLSNKQKGGTFLGVFLMGSLSSLIVSPCVSAPMVGILAYISNTGNIVLGGFALLVLGIGMGFPLLLIGTSAGHCIPKSGPWMNCLRKIFGVLMLGFAIWMVSRVVSGPVILFLSSMLIILCGMIIHQLILFSGKWRLLQSTLRILLITYGAILLAGSVMGGSEFLHPWENLPIFSKKTSAIQFTRVKNKSELAEKLSQAQKEKKPVLLDFYADWCTACIAMDKEVFNNPAVKAALKNYTLLRVDITDYNETDRNLMQDHRIIAPPTILLFNASGTEVPEARIVGEQSLARFLEKIKE